MDNEVINYKAVIVTLGEVTTAPVGTMSDGVYQLGVCDGSTDRAKIIEVTIKTIAEAHNIEGKALKFGGPSHA